MLATTLLLVGVVWGYASTPNPTTMPTTSKLGAFRNITVPTFTKKNPNAAQFKINSLPAGKTKQDLINQFWRTNGAFLAPKNPIKLDDQGELDALYDMGYYFPLSMQNSPFLQPQISQLPWKYETVKLDEYDEPVENYAANATREPWATLANMDLQELCPPDSDAHWTVNWYTSMNWMDSEKNENNREKKSFVTYHGERDLVFGSGAAWGADLTKIKGDLVKEMNDTNARFDPEYAGMDSTTHPGLETKDFGSFGQYQGFGQHNMGADWVGKGYGYKGETGHQLQKLATSSGEYYYFCSQRNSAVTYLLGRLAMKQKSYVHTSLGQSEYENDDRKLGALLLPEVADSSDAQNRKFYLVAPFAPVGCTGHPIPYRGVYNSAASQHWAPLKHSSGFWADVTELNNHHLPYYNIHPRVPAIIKNLYNTVFSGSHTNKYSGCYERYIKGLYMVNQQSKPGLRDATEDVEQNFAPWPASSATQEMLADVDAMGQEPEIQLKASPLRLIFEAPDGNQYTWLKSKSYLGPSIAADDLENVKKTSCGDGTAQGTMVGWAPWMKRRAQVFCNDDFCNMHPYGTQYQTSDQQKLGVHQKDVKTTNSDLLSGNPNWLFNVVPDAPTWNMIEMDYTTEKRYDVSHCFNHIYVPENATFESWTTKVCNDPRGCLPLKFTTNPCIYDRGVLNSGAAGPLPLNHNITFPRGGAWDPMGASNDWGIPIPAYVFDDTVVTANEYVYPHAHWLQGDNFMANMISYGGMGWPPNPEVGRYFMCNETHGWYKDTWKSGNMAPTYMQNAQSDVYTWWQPFDTPGVWEAALMNAGRRRRDAPEPRNSSYITPVIPFTTEELERLQAGRSAHTLRAEYLDAAGYTQSFPYHDTKYSSAIDADTDLYWDMNNVEGATAGHPTIVQHIAATFIYAIPLTRKWSAAYDIKRADQAIFTNAKNAATGHFYDPIVNYMNQWPTYFDEDSFTASELAMMKWGAWEFLEGYATPSRNGHQSVFVGVSSTISIEDTWDLRYPLCTGANCPDSCDVGTTAKVLFDCYMAIDERKYVDSDYITGLSDNLGSDPQTIGGGQGSYTVPQAANDAKSNFHSEIILSKGDGCAYEITILTDCDSYAQILTAQPEFLFNRKRVEAEGLITPMMDLDQIYDDIDGFWGNGKTFNATAPGQPMTTATTTTTTTTTAPDSSAAFNAVSIFALLLVKLLL